jgi:hypothetical protein
MSKSLIKPSKTIKPNYNKSAAGGLGFNITGRGPSVLTYGNQAPQGDHVTAYRLIEEGLYRVLDSLSADEVENLFSLENRELLRNRRGMLYDYVSAIAVLDPKRKESLYKAMDGVLKDYNQGRYKKTQIRQDVVALHENPDLVDAPYKQALDGLEARFKTNGEKVRDLFKSLSAILLTFYNKIPLTAYHYIEGFKEDAGDIKATKTKIGKILDWHNKQTKKVGSPALAAKRIEVVEAMNALIHYEEITNEELLGEHRAENNTKEGKTNQPRNNDKETLVKILARHIHIFFAVYPELKEIFNQENELIDNFIDKFIGKGTNKPNWPKFANKTDIADIKNKVKEAVAKLKVDLGANNYNQWKTGKDLDSSDDEEIDTKPRAKIAPVKAQLLTDVQIRSLQEELEELRAMKKVVEENRRSIPKEVMSQIDEIFSDKSHSKQKSDGR